MLLRQSMINGIHLGLSLRGRDGWPQACDDVIVIATTLVSARIRRWREPGVDALCRRKIRGKSKSCRHYAYHCVALPIDINRTAAISSNALARRRQSANLGYAVQMPHRFVFALVDHICTSRSD